MAGLFSVEMMSQVTSIPIMQGLRSDQLIWSHDSTSSPSSQHFYSLIAPSQSENANIEFAWVWRLPVLARVRTFWGKLLWKCLPCKSELVRRGILSSSNLFCDLCHLEECCVHVILSCPFGIACRRLVSSRCGRYLKVKQIL